jgi:eukaryotic-like serine/threonine-protein kinase
MTWISDATARHLRQVADWPDLGGTKYELLEEIGRGGMGTVYRARDRELERDVAIKVTSVPGVSDDERLRAEARVLASLEHPGIVAVHESGRLPDGRAFYVMSLVAGDQLDDRLRAVPALPDRLRLFDRICDIVAFAHTHGVVHRDLKPANIMVGAFGDVRVLDWGLARRPHTAQDEVATGGSGTEGYMAPEQARGQADDRSDVFSLGVLLREFVASERTAAPRRVRPLDSIVNRATADDPNQRYADVPALAADVRRFLDGDRVTAHRESPFERGGRLLRVYRTPIALILGYLVMRVLLLLWR